MKMLCLQAEDGIRAIGVTGVQTCARPILEVQQIASALSEKWNAEQREKLRFDEARAAEQEARAYAASLGTMNRALETARSAAAGSRS